MAGQTTPLSAIAMATLALCSACSNVTPVETVTLLNHRQCQNLTAGIKETTLEALPSLRTSRLLPAPDDAPITPTQQVPELDSTRVFAVSKGPQPTPGYAFRFEGAELAGQSLALRFTWESPAADSVQPQVMTHPCMVLAVPVTRATRLIATDQDGAFAELMLN
ncbi:MAG: protease complex subunit PrcB family protein [Pseudomonadota bacterium]